MDARRQSKLDALFVAACYQGNVHGMQRALEAGADVNASNDDVHLDCRASGLYFVCRHGNDKIVQLLLDYGADVNHTANDGASPLFTASACGHVEVARLLLKNGADVNLSLIHI